MIPEEKMQEIISHLGKKGNKAFFLLDDYKDEIATARDANGNSLLAQAIKKNDGGNICFLLRCGADPHALAKENGKMTNLEYAEKYATHNDRAPFAYEAISSYVKIKESMNMEIMHDSVFKKEVGKGSWFERAKNLPEEEFVSFYHGAKIHNLNDENLDAVKDGFLKSPGIQEFSGPTLSLKPIGQYWTTIGFEIKIPRSQVNFPGENKKDAVIYVSDQVADAGISVILTQDKTIKFKDYPSKMLINLRNAVVETEVLDVESDSFRNYADKFEMSSTTIDKLNQLQEIVKTLQPEIQVDTKEVVSKISTIREEHYPKGKENKNTNTI